MIQRAIVFLMLAVPVFASEPPPIQPKNLTLERQILTLLVSDMVGGLESSGRITAEAIEARKSNAKKISSDKFKRVSARFETHRQAPLDLLKEKANQIIDRYQRGLRQVRAKSRTALRGSGDASERARILKAETAWIAYQTARGVEFAHHTPDVVYSLYLNLLDDPEFLKKINNELEENLVADFAVSPVFQALSDCQKDVLARMQKLLARGKRVLEIPENERQPYELVITVGRTAVFLAAERCEELARNPAVSEVSGVKPAASATPAPEARGSSASSGR